MSASQVPSSSTSLTRQATTQRRYELDWLRIIAVLGLIPFHAAIVFSTGSADYVRNTQTTALMDDLAAFILVWGIPLIFLVAGAASRFALLSRTTKQYLYERVVRLMVPFLFGMLTIVPLQVYIGTLSGPEPHQSFFAFYGDFIQRVLLIFTGVLPKTGPEWIGHLWFIPPLMVFSVLALPLFHALNTEHGHNITGRIARWSKGYAPLALFGLPLALILITLNASVRQLSMSDAALAQNGIGLVTYFVFFLYGYILYVNEGFAAILQRDAWKALLLGALTWITLRFLLTPSNIPELSQAPLREVVQFLRGYDAWWWVMAILGFGMRFLAFTTSTLRYLTRATYPVYIIHMPILSLFAFWIVAWDLAILPKYFLIVLSTFAASLLIYEFILRRITPLRFLFGLSVQQPPSPQQSKRSGRTPLPPTMQTGGATAPRSNMTPSHEDAASEPLPT